MSVRPWLPGTNTFLVATRDSNRAAQKIFNFSMNAFNHDIAEAVFKGIVDTIKPYFLDFNSKHIAWKQAQGSTPVDTKLVTQKFATLSNPTIQDWQFDVEKVYREKTPEFQKLFPNGRSPFQSGTNDDRILALETLEKALSEDDQLKTIAGLVSNFLVELKALIGKQKGEITGIGSKSDALNAARIEMCYELDGALGLLKNHFKRTPQKVETYFDLQTIRNHEQTTFTHHLKPLESITALVHTFDADEQFAFHNNGLGKLKIYSVAKEGNPAGALFVIVDEKADVLLEADKLGDATNRFFIVENLSNTAEGKYTLKLL